MGALLRISPYVGDDALAFLDAAGGNLHPDDEWNQGSSIVGLWHVLYTGESDVNFPPGGPYPPPGFQFLDSLTTWHAGGTEFENAFVAPTGGNICFGVWKEVEKHQIKPHHIGFMFDAKGDVANIFTDDEIVTVGSNSKTCSGRLTSGSGRAATTRLASGRR
jgi:hypothetical protein